jgi:hypothetical protein
LSRGPATPFGTCGTFVPVVPLVPFVVTHVTTGVDRLGWR